MQRTPPNEIMPAIASDVSYFSPRMSLPNIPVNTGDKKPRTVESATLKTVNVQKPVAIAKKPNSPLKSNYQ